MSRQLDLQLYKALNGYPLEEVPEERFDDYMDVHYYSKDAEAMLVLDREMKRRGWGLSVERTSTGRFVAYYETRDSAADGVADTEPFARALAAYNALTGKVWQK